VRTGVEDTDVGVIVAEQARYGVRALDRRTLDVIDDPLILAGLWVKLRELVARDYVTYERMREFKAELMTAIKSQADSVATIHARLDTLIHNIARIDKRSQDA
jgi:hypothetical protein